MSERLPTSPRPPTFGFPFQFGFRSGHGFDVDCGLCDWTAHRPEGQQMQALDAIREHQRTHRPDPNPMPRIRLFWPPRRWRGRR